MSTQAVADARLALLYHSAWDRSIAVETFATWDREDFVSLAGAAEAIWAYDRSPDALDDGVGRVLGISQVLHAWAGQLEDYRRHYRTWLTDRARGVEPIDPFPPVHRGAGKADAPNHMLRRLAGSVLRDGTFAKIVAPGTSWISRTSLDQLHRVMQVETDRRTRIMDRTRAEQMKAGAREVAAQRAADLSIDWAPIEARLHQQVATRNLGM